MPIGWHPTAGLAAIHELAHALVGLEPDAKLTYAQEELVVESVAWSCCQTVGSDTSANSIPYLASWAEQASLEVLEQTAAITGRLAQRIEAALVLGHRFRAGRGVGAPSGPSCQIFR